MKKIYKLVLVALILISPVNALAYYHGHYGGGPRFGFSYNTYAPIYPPVYGGYAYTAPPVIYAPPPVVYSQPPVVYANPPVQQNQPVSNEQYCREYQGPINVGGRVQQGYGTACEQPDGSWHLIQ